MQFVVALSFDSEARPFLYTCAGAKNAAEALGGALLKYQDKGTLMGWRIADAEGKPMQEPALDPEVLEAMANGMKIKAIKRVREMTGWNLKEAKHFIDNME